MHALLFIAVILALLGGQVPPAVAKRDQDKARDAVRSGQVLSFKQIRRSVLSSHPGRILDAELTERRGVPVYDVRVLQQNGRVIRLLIDARSARILGVRGN